MNSTAMRVAIVGAGPGGLILARILQLHGQSVTVYESEPAADSRPQGGTLDMHPSSGRWAIKQAGLDAEFLAHARPEEQGKRILDPAGKVWLDDQDDDDRPEIDRGALRGLLLDSLLPNTVRWGHRLSRVELGPSGPTLTFQNGVSESAELVVGADGAWSRVRPLLSDAVPNYTGVTFIETTISDVDARFPALSNLIGGGSLSVLGGGKNLIAQRNGHHLLRVYAALKVPQDWVQTDLPDMADCAAVRKSLLGNYAGWAPEVLALLENSDDHFIPRPIFMLPVGHHWAPQPGVTLLGDAAHLMSPFSGMGANLAMQDGAELAQALLTETTLAEALARYESAMFQRAESAAYVAAQGLESSFAPDALHRTLAFFQEHFGGSGAEEGIGRSTY